MRFVGIDVYPLQVSSWFFKAGSVSMYTHVILSTALPLTKNVEYVLEKLLCCGQSGEGYETSDLNKVKVRVGFWLEGSESVLDM